ncbi:hypothetical protein E2C01_048510 [Portunus trituberculatus]|uniref:Uncharacterized protein n=1 Tax=Portunus trituberculatus TaxID=210409 RepID=A0A5B7GBU0_PORTR|nr:hypothetical protein [Portunus trituberculatus]
MRDGGEGRNESKDGGGGADACWRQERGDKVEETERGRREMEGWRKVGGGAVGEAWWMGDGRRGEGRAEAGRRRGPRQQSVCCWPAGEVCVCVFVLLAPPPVDDSSRLAPPLSPSLPFSTTPTTPSTIGAITKPPPSAPPPSPPPPSSTSLHHHHHHRHGHST